MHVGKVYLIRKFPDTVKNTPIGFFIPAIKMYYKLSCVKQHPPCHLPVLEVRSPGVLCPGSPGVLPRLGSGLETLGETPAQGHARCC